MKMDQQAIANFSGQYLTALAQLKTELESTQKKLVAEERTDEARFAKIQLNIVDIFEKMYHASVKRSGTEANFDGICKTYQNYLETIPTNWRISLEEAERHNNHEEAHIERIKLSQAQEVKQLFDNHKCCFES